MADFSAFHKATNPRVRGILNYASRNENGCKIISDNEMKDRGFSQNKKGYWLIKVKYPCKNFAYHHLHKVVFELHHGKFFSFEIETENNASLEMAQNIQKSNTKIFLKGEITSVVLYIHL